MLTVEWEPAIEAVAMNWHAFAEGETYRDGLETGLELVQEKGATNWLADLRDLGTVTAADREWTHEDRHPRAFETTLSNIAVVQPESVVANMSVEDLVTELGENVTVRVFDDRTEAESWLEAQA